MTIHIPDGFAQVVIQIDGPSATGVHHGVVTCGTGGVAGFTLDQVAGFWVEALGDSNIWENMHEAYQGRTVTVFTETEGAVRTILTPSTRTGAASPPTVSTLCRKVTNLRGHANQGRWYWPGLLLDSEVDDSGNISTGVLSDLQTNFDDMLASLVGNEVQPFILHNDPGVDPTPISSFLVERTIASQRRRLGR